MYEVQSSEVKARLPHFLDEVEKGETIVITRHGRPIAHLVPASNSYRDSVARALSIISGLRRHVAPMSAAEILAAKREGHNY